MPRLNKHQQRRIRAQKAEKLADANAENSALIIAHMGSQIIAQQHGCLIPCSWRRQSADIAINDRVLIAQNPDGSAAVEAIYPRSNVLYKWQGRKAKAIAANLDRLLIVIAVEPDWQAPLVDRYLIAAREAGIEPALLINKTDLLDETAAAALESRLAPYRALDIPLFKASIHSGCGMDAIDSWLQGKQTILCGQSGVGKSSLIRRLVPDADIWVQNISAATGLGKHTTTNLRLYPITANTAIIDTPGVRGFAITHLSKSTILAGFPDITPHAEHCRFNDCRHQNEPDCGVRAALVQGKIYPERWQSLQQLLTEFPVETKP